MHSRPFTFIFMLAALFLLRGNASGQATEFPPQGDYKLTGVVVNSATGEPIRRALVTDGAHSVLTDSEGKFEFDGLARGGTNVDVTKPGFLREGEHRFGNGSSYSGRQVQVGPDSASVTLKLIPEGIIFGKVESNGEPISNFPIKLITSQVIDGRRQWVNAAVTQSDDDGEFRIADLAAGTYYLSAGPSWTDKTSIGGNSSEMEQGYAETFYPQSSELAGAGAIKISPGDQTEADFSLKPARLYKVEGFIRGVSPRGGTNLQFINAEGEVAQFPVHYNPATGGFQTLAPAGAYTLKAESYAVGAPSMVASVPLNISADVAGIQLVPGLAISIPVQIQKDAVQPLNTNSSFTMSGIMNGRSFTLSGNDGSNTNVALLSGEQSLHNQQYTSSYRVVGDTPMMEIANVEPGRYVANITVGQEWYVESAQCGSVDLLREELTVGVGTQPPPISVVIRNDPAEINGKISREAQPGQGQSVEAQTSGRSGNEGEEGTKASVLIVPDGRPLGAKEVEVGPNGNFFIPGLAPGEYEVLAFDHTEDVEYTNPEVLRLYLPRAQHIVLQPSQKLQLNLEVVKVE